MDRLKFLPIGREDFKEIIENNGYYVDKTLLIKKILETQSKVTLFTRPRRFGKTLNMSMIQNFLKIPGKIKESCSKILEFKMKQSFVINTWGSIR